MWIIFFFFLKMSSRLMHNQFLLPINFKLYIIIKKININVYVFVLIFILFNECKYIYFLDILYNKDIIVNLYKLYFSSFHFSLQPNNKFFHSPTFPSSRFSTLSTKRILRDLSGRCRIICSFVHITLLPCIQVSSKLIMRMYCIH